MLARQGFLRLKPLCQPQDVYNLLLEPDTHITTKKKFLEYKKICKALSS
jgi:hypothetical protein